MGLVISKGLTLRKEPSAWAEGGVATTITVDGITLLVATLQAL
jgi:hypothetical protein